MDGVFSVAAEPREQPVGEKHRDLVGVDLGAVDFDDLACTGRLPRAPKLTAEFDRRFLGVAGRQVRAETFEPVPDVRLARSDVNDVQELRRGPVDGTASEREDRSAEREERERERKPPRGPR